MRLFDAGLQPERTELAWRRTALALAAGSLISLRLLPAVFGGIAWITPGIVGVLASGVIWLAVRRRFARVNAVLLEHVDAPLPDGRLLLAAAVFVLAGGIAGLALAVVVALG